MPGVSFSTKIVFSIYKYFLKRPTMFISINCHVIMDVLSYSSDWDTKGRNPQAEKMPP